MHFMTIPTARYCIEQPGTMPLIQQEWSILNSCARTNEFICDQVLLQHGSQIEYKDSDGQTALSSAAIYDSISVAKV